LIEEKSLKNRVFVSSTIYMSRKVLLALTTNGRISVKRKLIIFTNGFFHSFFKDQCHPDQSHRKTNKTITNKIVSK